MGLNEVSSTTSAAPLQQKDTKKKVQKKALQEQTAAAELPNALAKNSKANNTKEAMPLKLQKKEGLSTGEKAALGAALLGGAAAILSFVKPSAGKALKLAAQTAKAGNAANKGLKARHAVAAVGVLGGSAILGSCDKGLLEEEHNHKVPLPTDTIEKEKFIEKIIEKYITITKTDTIVKNDTIKVPEYIYKDSIVYKDSIIHDTTFIDRPVYIEVPGETVYVKEDFKSEVPDKIKDMLDDLGIDTTGVGKFVYGLDWQDAKNNVVHRTMWDGGRTTRDGDVYVMNDIGTGWSDPDEGYVFGKNENFKKHELYLNGSNNLSDCENTPTSPINVSNNSGAPNWFVFQSGEPTAEPGNWTRNNPRTFTKISDGRWKSSDGFIYERTDKPNTIKKINSHGSEWLLKNVSIIGGNDAKDVK